MIGYPSDKSGIARAIRDVMLANVEELTKKALEDAKKELDARLPAIVAQIAINVEQYYSTTSFDQGFTISVNTHGGK
jgi:hypothetical protein